MAAPVPLILLTGGTGFVGRQILRTLALRNQRVRLVVRDESKVEHSVAVESVRRTNDLFNEGPEFFRKLCEDVDTIIHGAWYAAPGQYLQSDKNSDCLAGTLRFAQAAVQAKVRRFVGIGSCFEYDLSQGTLSTTTALKPSTAYARAKAEAFQLLSQVLPQHGVEFAWCRLFYLYGENEDARRLAPYLHSRLKAGEPADLTSGTQVRDYLDVAEAGRMIVDTALGTARGPVNICSGRPVTVRQFAERIADQYGRRDLLRFGARPDNLTDPPRVVGVRAA